MADISTGRQRGIVPFVDETTGRLPDQYIPQRVIDLQGELEQAVTGASASATAASQSASQAQSSATAADSSARSASTSSESAKTASDSATSSKNAAAQSASQASVSASAAKASETNAASSASAAKVSETNAAAAARNAVEEFGLEFATTANSALSKADTAQGTANSALSQSSRVEQSLNSFKTSVSRDYQTKTDALSQKSELEQNINANSQNFITNPQFKSGNADGMINTQMEASDSNAGKLPGTATSYGKSTGGYDNWCGNVQIKGIPGHTYRIEIDAKRASDNTDTSYDEGIGLFFWYLPEDNPGLSSKGYTPYNKHLIPASVTDWTHGTYDYVFPSNSNIKVIRPAYRTPQTKHWLVTNFTCTDITAIAEAQKDADTANSTANSALSELAVMQTRLQALEARVNSLENN